METLQPNFICFYNAPMIILCVEFKQFSIVLINFILWNMYDNLLKKKSFSEEKNSLIN